IEKEMRQPGAVAVPLIRDATREILENTKLKIDPRVEGATRAAEQPALPVCVLLADGRDVLALRQMPPRSIEIPALIDRDDFAYFPAADDLTDLVVPGATDPLRAHLHYLLARSHRVPRQLGLFQGVGQRLLAITILAGADHLHQQLGV